METIHDNLQGFPSLHAISLKAENIDAKLHAERIAIAQSERYNDNPSERQYQLDKIDEQYQTELAKADEDWAIEVAAIQKDMAGRAFDITVGTEEERRAAGQLVETVKAQLVTTPDVLGTIEMLTVKTMYMSDAEKVAVASKLDALQTDALSQAEGSEEIAEIKHEFEMMKRNVSDVKAYKDALTQRKEIKRIASQTPPGISAKRVREIAKSYWGKGLV